MPTEDVLCRIEGVAGRITLNRPRALNALSHEMIGLIQAALDTWATDPAVQLVLLDGAGDRGLCAGGDIRFLYAAAKATTPELADAFFTDEYALNASIAAYPKPYVAFMDGITFGGGIGVSAHGSHRVVTERSDLAMPETGIGIIPDVGTSYLLGRAPDQLGLHAGLTGMRFGAADAIALGLADLCVPSAALPDLAAALIAGAPVDQTLNDAATPPPDGSFDTARAWIAPCYAAATVAEILTALRARPERAAQDAAALLETRSPTMLQVARRAITESGADTLAGALAREYRIVHLAMRGTEFIEGVRAQVIDKDRAPYWYPATLEAVPQALVDSYFAPITAQ